MAETPTLLPSRTATQPFHWHYDEVDDNNFHFHVHTHGLLPVILIFAFILLFAIVCIYARWACRYRSMVITVSSGGHGPGPVGLDKVAIESVPVRIHVASGTGEEKQCPICLSGLVEGEKVKVMPECEHKFHPECVDQWLRAHPTCPLCRNPICRKESEVAVDVV